MPNCEVVTFPFPIGILGQVWCLIVSISDLCTHSYFIMTLTVNSHFDVTYVAAVDIEDLT